MDLEFRNVNRVVKCFNKILILFFFSGGNPYSMREGVNTEEGDD